MNFKVRYCKNKVIDFNIKFSNTNVKNQKAHYIERKFNKIFCIGLNKTGTTSMSVALSNLGFTIGEQSASEMLMKDYFEKDYTRILKYCNTADAFQDIPFSFMNLYKILYANFPNSKFILTIRNSPEQWFNSLVNFHRKLFSRDIEKNPTIEDLMNSTYRYKGFMLETMQHFGYPDVPLYDKDYYIKIYNKHINDAKNFFVNKPNSFIILNISEIGSYEQLLNFLSIKSKDNKIEFPWFNKT